MKSLFTRYMLIGILSLSTVPVVFAGDPSPDINVLESWFNFCKTLPDAAFQKCVMSILEQSKQDYSAHPRSGPSIFESVILGHTDQRQQQQYAREQVDQLERQRDRETMLEAARLQALGLALSGGGPFHFNAPPIHHPPLPLSMPAPVPLYQAPVARPPVNCTSNTVNNYTYTNCY